MNYRQLTQACDTELKDENEVRGFPGSRERKGQPQEVADAGGTCLPVIETIWRERYRSIVDLENHLHRNGVYRHLKVEQSWKLAKDTFGLLPFDKIVS